MRKLSVSIYFAMIPLDHPRDRPSIHRNPVKNLGAGLIQMQGLVEPAKGASKGLTLRYMGLRQADWVERSNETMMKISLDRCQHQVYGYPDNRYRKEGMKGAVKGI